VKLQFGTKAETLARLAGHLQSSYVLPLVCFGYAEWSADPESCLARVADLELEEALAELLVVRSSARGEDGEEALTRRS
jgi:glutamine kinase